MIEFTTKLERFDRPLTHGEAKALSGLSETEWNNLVTTTRKIAVKLQEIFERSGIELWDGKVEFAAGARFKGQREIVLVDTIGPDELRLTKSGVALSKEFIRQYYRKLTWYKDLELVKEKFGEEFKEHIDAPPKLKESFLSAVKDMYELLPLVIKDPSKTPDLDQLISKLKGEL